MTPEQARQLRKLLEDETDIMIDEQIIHFPAFVEKWKTAQYYIAGKRLSFNNTVYKVLKNHVSQEDWAPDQAPSLFARVLIPNPGVIPEWEQPDSTNPYMKKDKVTHNQKTWESDIDNNVWEPGIYGWHEVL